MSAAAFLFGAPGAAAARALVAYAYAGGVAAAVAVDAGGIVHVGCGMRREMGGCLVLQAQRAAVDGDEVVTADFECTNRFWSVRTEEGWVHGFVVVEHAWNFSTREV